MALVSDILSRKGKDVVTVSPRQTVMEAVRRMNERKIGAVMVLDGETVAGIFTERDLLNRVVAKRLDPGKIDIGTVMTTPIAYCSPETSIADCRSAMTQKKIRHLPVVEGGKLAGLISIGDLMAWELSEHESTIRYLNEYIYGR